MKHNEMKLNSKMAAILAAAISATNLTSANTITPISPGHTLQVDNNKKAKPMPILKLNISAPNRSTFVAMHSSHSSQSSHSSHSSHRSHYSSRFV